MWWWTKSPSGLPRRWILLRQRPLWRRRQSFARQHARANNSLLRLLLTTFLSFLSPLLAFCIAGFHHWFVQGSCARPLRELIFTAMTSIADIVFLHAGCFALLKRLRSFRTGASISSGTKSRRGPKTSIFIRGLTARTIIVSVAHGDTIGTVLDSLHRRHLLPKLSRLRHYIVFPPYSQSPLGPNEVLEEIGVCSNSTIHIRASILGGARSELSQGTHANNRRHTSIEFGASTGNFPSFYPERWISVAPGEFKCLPCGLQVSHRHIARHEASKKHLRHVEVYLRNPQLHHGVSEATSIQQQRRETVRGPLVHLLSDTISRVHRREEWINPETGIVDWSSDQLDSYSHHVPFDDRVLADLSAYVQEYLLSDGAIDADSDDEVHERDQESIHDTSNNVQDFQGIEDEPADPFTSRQKKRRCNGLNEHDAWFPWPDKETCVLDIVRHIPRCAFSEKQNAVIHWALGALGVQDIPSERTMKDVDTALQKLCGLESIRFTGALGHPYYTNDFAGIVAQEMSNPRVRPFLRFLPEDAGQRLSEAWQGRRWLNELDASLTTPMIRSHGQDFYIYEPAMLRGGMVCMLRRWFTRGDETVAKAWRMRSNGNGWVVEEHIELEVNASDLILSGPHLIETSKMRGIPDPRNIIGVEAQTFGPIQPWTRTDSRLGNPWRSKASGHQVVAFPVWLYCDDTSGNLSKKWNKHNSFLFTAAGLPRRFVHREYNVHFLSTSNLAPPLEMLDGIVNQLKESQGHGIWAWDCVLKEMVLVIPSVLAMLGDNPMQSEIACHVGLMGKMFCRVCWAKGEAQVETEEDGGPHHAQSGGSNQSSAQSVAADDSNTGSKGKSRRRKAPETMAAMVNRVTHFMTAGRSRTRTETLKTLSSQFAAAKDIGGFTKVKKMRTDTGIKDTFQDFFLDRLFNISKKRGPSRADKEVDLTAACREMPDEDSLVSPVWRIKDFDPHSDTPVEILHVILLGFVKYFWRDTIARLKDDAKSILITRLSSFDITGLGLSPLASTTLVNYSGSLTGRDFRAIVQAAPFLLHDLDLSNELLEVWSALNKLVPLVWQPEIEEVDSHIAQLTTAINYFLDTICNVTPCWFNKPKFHIILHLPEHIRRFGPPMLFATEGFESFNAVIRSHSVHSNRHAPSRDIAHSMARCSRVRHLLSRGYFPVITGSASTSHSANSTVEQNISPWHQKSNRLKLEVSSERHWLAIGKSPLALLTWNHFASKILGWDDLDDVGTEIVVGACKHVGAFGHWADLFSGSLGETSPFHDQGDDRLHRTVQSVCISNGDWASAEDWIIWDEPDFSTEQTSRRLGRIVNILQSQGTQQELDGKANIIIVSRANIGDVHEQYRLPMVTLLEDYIALQPEDALCTVNVQHNCIDHQCRVEKTRIVYEERERTTKTTNTIKHAHSADFILNLGQMRDSIILNSFRSPIPILDRDRIIHSSAAREVEAQKQRQKAMSNNVNPKGKGKATSHVPVPSRLAQISGDYPSGLLPSSESSLGNPSSTASAPQLHQAYHDRSTPANPAPSLYFQSYGQPQTVHPHNYHHNTAPAEMQHPRADHGASHPLYTAPVQYPYYYHAPY